MKSIKDELRRFLSSNNLLKGALLAGKIQDPKFCERPYVERVLEVAAVVWNRLSKHQMGSLDRVAAINRTLYDDFEFQGKTPGARQIIDDPNRFYLHAILDGKQGSPLGLTVLYSIVAQQIALEHEVIALPSSYLVRLAEDDQNYYVDPFDRGKCLNQEEFDKKLKSEMHRSRVVSTNLFETVGPSQLVARVFQQLKHVYILKGKALEALRSVDLLKVIFPDSPELTRDRGILYCEMEYFSKAIRDLKKYIRERPNADDISEIRKLTSILRGYREIVN